MKINLLFAIFLRFYISAHSQTINWISDPHLRVYSYTVINNYYTGKSTPTPTFTVHASFGIATTKTILSVTGINSGQNINSFGFRLQTFGLTATKFSFSVQVLNQTVLYRLNIDALIMYSLIQDYYSEYGKLTCTILNKGVGLLSENYSIQIAPSRPYYNYDAGAVLLTVYPSGCVVYNPSGSYLNLNWKTYINKTHYTILFQTTEQNLVQMIQFNIISYDNTYIKNVNYYRIVSLGVIVCPGTGCMGTGGWSAGSKFEDVHKQFWGMSGFNFTKSLQINWYLNTTSYSDLSIGYIHTPGIISLQISGIIVAARKCIDFDSLLDEYFDPSNLQCKTTCTVSPYLFKNVAAKVCAKCHYSCQTCSSYTVNKCTSCNAERYNVTNTVYFVCTCKIQYVDVGIAQCKKCYTLMPGCNTCDTYSHCLTCNTGLQLNSNQNRCQCMNVNFSMTRYGQCIDLRACLNYFNASNGTILCIQCDFKKNYQLISYQCLCQNGYEQKLGSDGKTFQCFEICGNKIITDFEECDDGNLIEGDGCNKVCEIQQSYSCFNGYLDASFCIKNWAKLNHYMTLKNINKHNSVDIYFSFEPFDQKIINHIQMFKQLFYFSFEKQSKYSNFAYRFQQNISNKIKFILSFNYLQHIDESIQQSLYFKVKDSSLQNNTLSQMVKFSLQSKNYPLDLKSSSAQTYTVFSYVLLVCIIGGYLVMFTSLFTQNWIGIQLMQMYQYLFFYCFLLNKIQAELSQFTFKLKLTTGYNKIIQNLSPYEYYLYNDKLFTFEYPKSFILNFNYAAILFGLSILLLIIKKIVQLRKPINSKNDVNYPLKSLKLIQKQKSSSMISKICTKKFLKTDFICGKLFISFVMVNLFQTIFSFYVQQSHYQASDLTFNNSSYSSTFMYAILTLQLSFIIWIFIQICQKSLFNNSLRDILYKRIFTFSDFKNSYPLFYITGQLIKFTLFTMFHQQQYCISIMIGFDSYFLLFYLLYRPYTIKSNQNQSGFSWNILHNGHNIWNSIGLIGFLIIILSCNKNHGSQIQKFSPIIVFYIITICCISLILGFTRLLKQNNVFEYCKKCQKLQKDQTYKQIQPQKSLMTSIPNNMVSERGRKTRQLKPLRKQSIYKRQLNLFEGIDNKIKQEQIKNNVNKVDQNENLSPRLRKQINYNKRKNNRIKNQQKNEIKIVSG